MTFSKVNTALVAFFALVAIVGVLRFAENRAEQLNARADCVAQKAQADNYPLNPHGAEAWKTYAEVCANAGYRAINKK